jgi:hypothetical protein
MIHLNGMPNLGDHSIELLIISSIVILIAYFIIRSRKHKKRLHKILQKTYFSNFGYIPTYEEKGLYGYPHFTIYFQNKEELAIAREKGINKTLLKELKVFYSNIKDFKPEQSVYFEVLG